MGKQARLEVGAIEVLLEQHTSLLFPVVSQATGFSPFFKELLLCAEHTNIAD